MSVRRCSACETIIPPDADLCPVDGLWFTSAETTFGEVAGEPSLADPVRYERIEHVAPLAPPPTADGFATVPLSEEWA